MTSEWINLKDNSAPKSDTTVNLKMKDGSIVKNVKARIISWSDKSINVESYQLVSEPDTIRLPECSVASDVIKQIKERADVGLTKYGVTLDRDDLSLEEWLQHAIEEALDFAGYLTKLKEIIKDK